VRDIFLHGFMSFAAVTVIVACLLIMGSFTLITINIGEIVDRAANENEMMAYVEESLTDAEARSVGSRINAIGNVRSSMFISREKALEDYRERLGDQGDLLEGLEQNPLRHRYRVFLIDIALMQETADRIGDIAGIAKVSARVDISEGFITVRQIISAVSMTLIIMLLAVSVFIISNTIKLATFDRREEIAIMKMVGATNSFIRWPFVVEGALLGLTGALGAFFIQWVVYEYIARSISGEYRMIETIPFTSLALPIACVFLLTGLLVGMAGSVMTIRKYLKV